MTTLPTKPLFTARFTLVNTSYYTPEKVLATFRPELEKAGYTIYQTPAFKGYTAKYKLTTEGPFPDDDTKAIFETMEIAGPDGTPLSTARDKVNDPQGSRPILEQRKPMVSAFAWNLGPPAGATSQNLSDLIWNIRRTTLYDKEKYLGLGWTPIVLPWESTPLKRAPYPDRPAIPAVLHPPTPKPIVTPPPPTPPAPLPPAPTPPPSTFPLMAVLLGLGIFGAWAYFGRNET